MAGYDQALLQGNVCQYWHNLQLDDCLINQPNQLGTTTKWYEYMPFGEMLMEQSSGVITNFFRKNIV